MNSALLIKLNVFVRAGSKDCGEITAAQEQKDLELARSGAVQQCHHQR